MNTKEMDMLIAHFDKYFEQDDSVVLHPTANMNPHIDALLYKPTEKYPFWKLVTMGASDYKMSAPRNTLGNRNEYIMAIDSAEDMTESKVANWYYSMLLEIAAYPAISNSFITYGHSIEWTADAGEEMTGAYIEFPQMIENTGILRCKLGAFKTAICLLAVLINRTEMDKLLKDGSESFSYYLFPEDESTCHFLSERVRTDKF